MTYGILPRGILPSAGELDLWKRQSAISPSSIYDRYLSPRLQQADISLWQGQPIPPQPSPQQPPLWQRALGGVWETLQKGEKYLREYYRRPVQTLLTLPWHVTPETFPMFEPPEAIKPWMRKPPLSWAFTEVPEEEAVRRQEAGIPVVRTPIEAFQTLGPSGYLRERYEKAEMPRGMKTAAGVYAEAPIWLGIGKGVGKIPIRGVPISTREARALTRIMPKAITRRLGMRAYNQWLKKEGVPAYTKWLRSQGVKPLPAKVEATLARFYTRDVMEQFIATYTGRQVAPSLVQQMATKRYADLVAQYGQRAVSLYQGQGMTIKVARGIERHALRTGDTALANSARRLIEGFQRLGKAEISGELLKNKLYLDFIKRFKPTGVERPPLNAMDWEWMQTARKVNWAKMAGLPTSVGKKPFGALTQVEKDALMVAYQRPEVARQAGELGYTAAKYATEQVKGYFPLIYNTNIALEGANTTTHRLVMDVSHNIISQGITAPSITPTFINSLTAGARLSGTAGLISVLRAIGFNAKAIKAMSPNEAWGNLLRAVAPEAVTPTVAPPIPKAPPTAIAPTEPLKAPPLEVPEVTPAIPQPRIIPTTYTAEEVAMIDAELGGLREWLATEPAGKLIGLIKKTGWYKGEVSNLTLRQYRELTGKTPSASILTPDKKHVRWEYALDDVATEMGYGSGDELKVAIERAGEASTRIASLEAELAEVPRVAITTQVKDLYSEIDIEIKAAQAAIKGLTGEEARITRQTLAGLERELIYVNRTLKGFTQRPDLPDATKLRQTIHAFARYKGLSESALRDIYSSVSGRRQLSVIPQEQLVEILNRVKIARPVTIRGKKAITAKTENKAQTLKASLTARGQMNEVNFARLMKELNIKTPRYVNQYNFATESEGKSLIRAMLDDAEWIGQEIKVTEALSRNPEIKSQVDKLKHRLEKNLILNEEPIAKASVLQDIRYYAMSLEKQTGKPIYKAFQWVNDTHLRIRYNATRDFDRVITSTPGFERIAGSEVALKRVTDYIASKHRLGPKAPVNITPEEITLANSIEGVLRGFEGKVRLAKFYQAYELYPDNTQMMKQEVIRDAPAADLRRAIDIYEGRGKEALIEYLDTRTWGIIKSGYEPLSVVNPRMYLKGVKVGTFGKGHIQPREGLKYHTDDRNILQRLNSYIKQMYGMTELQPPVRRFIRTFEDAAPLIKNPRGVAENFTRSINEMKGYTDLGGPMGYYLARLYRQAMSAVFLQPRLWLRNLMIQNLGFHPDRHRFFLPSTHKPLSKENMIYFKVFVSQKMGLVRDYLMRQFKPLPGLGRLTRFADRLNRYPWTDETNRTKSFQMRYNRVQEALAKYREDKRVDKLMSRSGLVDLEQLQQVDALGLLARDTVDYNIAGLEPISGEEAFAQYVAKETTNNTHWLYERSQRAPIEMGPAGRIMGNLMTFPRSYYQRLIFQGRKLRRGSGATGAERRYALKTIIGMIVMGILVGEAYKRITGTKYNPGHPLYILTWTPGGLEVGSAIQLAETVHDLVMAGYGDKDALARFTTELPSTARIFIPFYVYIKQSLETATDKRFIDRYAMRLLRSAIDKEYEPRHEYYQMERDLITKLQHAFFGGEAPEKVEPEPRLRIPPRSILPKGLLPSMPEGLLPRSELWRQPPLR